LDDQGSTVWFLHGKRSFSPRLLLRSTQLHIQCVLWSLPKSKESGHEADHSVASNAKFMNECSYTFAPPYVLMVCTEATSPVHFWTKILHFFHHLLGVTVCSHTSSRYCILPWWWIDSFMVIHDLGCWSYEGYRVMNINFSERKVTYFKYI